MSLSRRQMLSLIGGGTVLAAGASGGAFLATRTPARALLPWEQAGTYPDLRRRALSWALLAPNPHNRQPWVAELEGENALTLYRDPALNLPETDPFDRQLTIGMGCFIELMVQAAAQERVGVTLDMFPDGEGPGTPIVRAQFGGPASPDPLFAQVPHRHTNRAPFDMDQRVAQADLDQITGASTGQVRAGGTIEEKEVAALRDLTHAAMVIEATTPRTLQETIDLMRIGKAEIEANPDGISLGGPFLETLSLAGILNRDAAADPQSSAFATMLDMFEASFSATPAFVWLTTGANTRLDQIDAGRSWVRLHLAATGLGLSMQPVSQALQEYPEMAGHYRNIHAMLAGNGETVQMLGRLGHGPSQTPSPRWPLEARLRHG